MQVADEPLVAERLQPAQLFEKLVLVNNCHVRLVLAETVGTTNRTSIIDMTIKSLPCFLMIAPRLCTNPV